jgi:oligoendopeptidase F
LNFTGNLRDVSVLAHELGHAYHGHLAQVQKAPVYDTPLSLAETASIFAEMLFSEYIQSSLTVEERQSYLNERLTDVFAMIFRQVQYVLFERRVYSLISE